MSSATLALRRVGGSSGLRIIERLVLGFFAGAGLWHIGLLALGYLNLYTVPVAIAITVPAVALSYPSARDAISQCWRSISPWRSLEWHERLMIASIGVVGLLLLLIKGLYPGGGHDYYTHYFYYYQTVIDHGGLWPNDVWYHYYYSKGSGLFFLGMLLTDPLAPQLVTFCFMAVAATALYLTVEDMAPKTSWPSVSVLVFISIYIFTPGWGEFEKDHEFNTALILGVIWMTLRLFREQIAAKLVFACALSITAAVIINTQSGLYFGAVFALLAMVLMTYRDRRNAIICAGLAAWAGAVIAGTLVLNYVTTGLPIDQGITWLWPLADVEKLYALGSLPMVIQLHWGTTGLVAEGVSLFSLRTCKLVVQSFRLDLLYPFIMPAVGIAAIATFYQKKPGQAGCVEIRQPFAFSSVHNRSGMCPCMPHHLPDHRTRAARQFSSLFHVCRTDHHPDGCHPLEHGDPGSRKPGRPHLRKPMDPAGRRRMLPVRHCRRLASQSPSRCIHEASGVRSWSHEH